MAAPVCPAYWSELDNLMLNKEPSSERLLWEEKKSWSPENVDSLNFTLVPTLDKHSWFLRKCITTGKYLRTFWIEFNGTNIFPFKMKPSNSGEQLSSQHRVKIHQHWLFFHWMSSEMPGSAKWNTSVQPAPTDATPTSAFFHPTFYSTFHWYTGFLLSLSPSCLQTSSFYTYSSFRQLLLLSPQITAPEQRNPGKMEERRCAAEPRWTKVGERHGHHVERGPFQDFLSCSHHIHTHTSNRGWIGGADMNAISLRGDSGAVMRLEDCPVRVTSPFTTP